MRRLTIVVLVGAFLATGCGGVDKAVNEEPTALAVAEPKPTPAILERPFTEEQIRDAFVVGLQISVRRVMEGAEVFERWTVVDADEEGVSIEYVLVDEAGDVYGEPRVQTSSWVEFRDHATFPAERSRREETTRDTRLGTLEGWQYTVEDPQNEDFTEFFFAASLPGPPVIFRVVVGGEAVIELDQLARTMTEPDAK